MPPSMKYAVVESERRYLVRAVPDGVTRTTTITDRYVTGTRVRLREVVEPDGAVVRKLNQKVRLGDGPEQIACTSVYLDEAEWSALSALVGPVLVKRRHHVERDGMHLVVDELADGTLLAEIDGGDQAPSGAPRWLDVVREVTGDEAWTGLGLATRLASAAG
jgi:CYTH domain-containing protein